MQRGARQDVLLVGGHGPELALKRHFGDRGESWEAFVVYLQLGDEGSPTPDSYGHA